MGEVILCVCGSAVGEVQISGGLNTFIAALSL